MPVSYLITFFGEKCSFSAIYGMSYGFFAGLLSYDIKMMR